MERGNPRSRNVGLSIATGTTSRVVGYAIGGFLICLAFIPKISSLFAILPKPVIGATLVFAISFMILAGVQIMMSRMIDARKTFVLGVSFIFGSRLDVEIHYQGELIEPPLVRPDPQLLLTEKGAP